MRFAPSRVHWTLNRVPDRGILGMRSTSDSQSALESEFSPIPVAYARPQIPTPGIRIDAQPGPSVVLVSGGSFFESWAPSWLLLLELQISPMHMHGFQGSQNLSDYDHVRGHLHLYASVRTSS